MTLASRVPLARVGGDLQHIDDAVDHDVEEHRALG